MMIGQRQRYCDLAVVLLAKLAAILPRHPNRMPTLLGKAGIVDDPGHDRTVPLDLWQHHLAHLGQHLLVRPLSLADKMQQRLMLGRRAIRRRDRRHRLHALALAWHQQAGAIMPQRLLAVLVTNHARKPLDIPRKSRFTVVSSSMIHLSPQADVNLNKN